MTTTQEWENNTNFLIEFIQEQYDTQIQKGMLSKEELSQIVYDNVYVYKNKRFDMELLDINKNVIQNVENNVKQKMEYYIQSHSKHITSNEISQYNNEHNKTTNMFGIYNSNIQHNPPKDEIITHEDLIMERRRTLDEVYSKKKNEMNSMLQKPPPQQIDFTDTFETNNENIDDLMEKELERRALEEKTIVSKLNTIHKEKPKMNHTLTIEENNSIPNSIPNSPRITPIVNEIKENKSTLHILDEEVNVDKDIKKLKPKKVSFDFETKDTNETKDTKINFMDKLNAIQQKRDETNLKTTTNTNTNDISIYHTMLNTIISNINDIKTDIQIIKDTLQLVKYSK